MTGAPTVRGYIAEQPEALARALAPLPDEVAAALRGLGAARGLGSVSGLGSVNGLGAASDLGSVSGLGDGATRRVLVVGSGTSSYAARAVLPVVRDTLAVPVEVYIPSDFLHYLPAGTLDASTLVIGISQSGRSTGTLHSLALARSVGAATILLTGDAPRAGIEEAVDLVVDIRSGPEQVGAKTKGYLCTVATLLLVAAALAGTEADARLAEVPSLVASLLASSAEVVADAAAAYPAELPGASLSVLASGPNQATALEASLKILETARIPVETFEVEEYLHGPHRRMTAATGLVVIATAGPVLPRAVALIEFAREHTESILVVTDAAAAAELPDLGPVVRVVTLPGSLPEELTPLLAIVPLQLLAASLTERVGLVAEDPVFSDFHTRLASKEPE